VRIDDLAAGVGTSVRTLERAFDETVGVSPKTLARIVRFRRALVLLDAPRRASFAAIALDCGYADQSHLVRDFRDFAGGPPTAYLAADRPMSDHFALDA
jgi:transcriptional regulator GlxA family with amidase domain